MAGLLIKELIARGDLQRCLIVCPGSLAEQWQDELSRRFHLPFGILTEEFNRAEALENDKRAGTVGFALTILQRRLGSSPEAIDQSLRRRRERLESRMRELEVLQRGGQAAPILAAAFPAPDSEDVIEVERGLGFEPTDREFEKLGDDIESRVPGTGKCRTRTSRADGISRPSSSPTSGRCIWAKARPNTAIRRSSSVGPTSPRVCG